MNEYIEVAIEEAKAGLESGGIPIGAVLVHDGKIIGRGHTLHGEMAALENAGRLPASVYKDSIMVTTLSPCAMCTGAMLLYGIKKVIVGENTTFQGEEELLKSRGVEVEVLHNEECIALMQNFIAAKPELWNEDIGE